MDISKNIEELEKKLNEGDNGIIFINELLDCFAHSIAANLTASTALGRIQSYDPYTTAIMIPLKTTLAMAHVSYNNLAEKWGLPSLKEMMETKE